MDFTLRCRRECEVRDSVVGDAVVRVPVQSERGTVWVAKFTTGFNADCKDRDRVAPWGQGTTRRRVPWWPRVVGDAVRDDTESPLPLAVGHDDYNRDAGRMLTQ